MGFDEVAHGLDHGIFEALLMGATISGRNAVDKGFEVLAWRIRPAQGDFKARGIAALDVQCSFRGLPMLVFCQLKIS